MKVINRTKGISRYQIIFCSIILLAGLFFLFVNIKMPLVGEDFSLQPWNYGQIPSSFVEKENLVFQRVIQQSNTWNPRIGEAFAIITGAFPPLVFDIINAILFIWLVFVLFIVGFGRFPDWKRPIDSFSISILIISILTLFPLFGQIFIWKAGTCNHIWGLTLLLSFIIPFRLNINKRVRIKSPLVLILFSILGFLAGLSVENASLIVMVALITYYLVMFKQDRIERKFIFPILSNSLGVCYLLFSPSTTFRRNYYLGLGLEGNSYGLVLYLKRFAKIFVDFISISWPLLVVLIFSLIYIFLINRINQPDGSIPNRNKQITNIDLVSLISLATSSLSILVLISIPYQSDQRRGFAFFWLIAIAVIALYISEAWESIIYRNIRISILVILLIIFIFQAGKILKVYEQFNLENKIRLEIIYSAIENGNKEITLPASSVQDSRIIETREILPDLGQRIATYYGLESVTIEK